MLLLDDIEMRGQLDADDGRERRDSVLVAFAGANDDLVPPEIDVFHPKPSAFQETQAGTIEQDGHEAGSATELTDDRPHFVTGEYDRQSHRSPGAHDIVEPRQILPKYFAVEEEQGAQRLILGGRGNVALDGQRAQILGQLRGTHPGRMTLPVKENVAPNPRDVGLLRPTTVVTGPHGLANPVEESWCSRRRWSHFSQRERGGGRRRVPQRHDHACPWEVSIGA